MWRIGENAGLNSAALYNALLCRSATQRLFAPVRRRHQGVEGVGQLPGGPIGVAVGLEARRESNALPLYSGIGDCIGLSLTSYGG